MLSHGSLSIFLLSRNHFYCATLT